MSEPTMEGLRITKSNYVYFVRALTLGLIKIGIAKNASARLIGMQTGSPDKLELMGVVRPRDEDPVFLEQRLHHRFRRHKSHGEWFHPVPALVEYIEQNAVSLEVDRQQLIYEAMERIGILEPSDQRTASAIQAELDAFRRAAELREQNLQPEQIVALMPRPSIPEGVPVPQGNGRKARMERYLLARGLER